MNVADLFVPMPPNAEETWDRLNTFVSAWWPVAGASEGTRSVELDRAEARLGVALPVAVRNAYCFFGRYPEITLGHVNLVKPDALAFRDEVLVLCVDDDEIRRWGVCRADLSRDDPPIVNQSFKAKHRGACEGVAAWVPAVERFSAYFAENALFLAADSAPYTNWMEQRGPVIVPDGLVQVSTGAPVSSISGTLLYGGDDVVVSVDGPSPLFNIGVAAPSEEAYQRALALFQGALWRQDPDTVHRSNYSQSLVNKAWLVGVLKASFKLKPKP